MDHSHSIVSPASLRWLAPLTLSLFAVNTLAQTIDAGSLLRQQEQQQRIPGRLPALEHEVERAPLKVGAGETIRIKAIRFSGATDLVPEVDLQALVADAIGKDLDFNALQQLAERVTAYLKGKGWFLARAYLPQQDVTAGVIEIALVAGRLAAKEPVRINADDKLPPRIHRDRLMVMADQQLSAGRAAHEDAVNRTVLLMNDLPGINARARLEPGDEAGETRVVLNVAEGPLFNPSLSVDNFGNRDTGREQLVATVNANDPLGIGDQITVAATASQGMQLGRLAYSLPIGHAGWKLNAGYSDMRYEVITGTGKTAGLEGSAKVVNLGVSYPLLRSRTANLYTSLGGQGKRLEDRSAAGVLNDRAVAVGQLTLSGDAFDNFGGGALSAGSLTYSVGNLDLRLPTAAIHDAAGYRTAGHYDKVSYNASRLQKLPGAFTGFVMLSGQIAGKNLDSSEKMMLGGPAGVRAYPGNEANADTATLLNLELRYDWPGVTPLGALQLQGFYDSGWARLHDDPRGLPISTASGRSSYRLSGTGVGATLSSPGQHQIRVIAARKLGDNPGRSAAGLDADSRQDTWRFWLQATLMF